MRTGTSGSASDGWSAEARLGYGEGELPCGAARKLDKSWTKHERGKATGFSVMCVGQCPVA